MRQNQKFWPGDLVVIPSLQGVHSGGESELVVDVDADGNIKVMDTDGDMEWWSGEGHVPLQDDTGVCLMERPGDAPKDAHYAVITDTKSVSGFSILGCSYSQDPPKGFDTMVPHRIRRLVDPTIRTPELDNELDMLRQFKLTVTAALDSMKACKDPDIGNRLRSLQTRLHRVSEGVTAQLKYVIFEGQYPALFDTCMKHSSVGDSTVTSAGLCQIWTDTSGAFKARCYDRSDSLGVESNPEEDNKLIERRLNSRA